MAKFNKLGIAFIAATAALVGIVPFVSVAEAKQFTDVQPTNSHYESIQALTEQGVVKGKHDGSYGINDPLQRRHGAVMLYEALDLQAPTDAKAALAVYNDVGEESYYAKQIAAVTKAGIFKGSLGVFNGTGDLTREQMATILVNGLGLINTGAEIDINLSNVSPSHKGNVEILAQYGITNQLDNFRPKESVTRGQFATFLYLTQKATSPELATSATHHHDTYYYVEKADLNAFHAVQFFNEESKPLAIADTSDFTISDSKGYFNSDGTLAAKYAKGLPANLIGSTVQIEVKQADKTVLGSFDVEIVDGQQIKEITRGVLLDKDNEQLSFVTVGSSATFEVIEAINYNHEIVGDDESFGLADLSNATIKSSDTSVFEITSDGKITPVKEGRANVIVAWDDKTFEMEVIVKAAPVADSIEFIEGNYMLQTTLFNVESYAFGILDQYGVEAENPGNLSIVPVEPSTAVEGLLVTINGNAIEIDATALNKSTVATYAIQSGSGKTLTEFTVEYVQTGETVELLPISDDENGIIDYNVNGQYESALPLALLGVDAQGYITEILDLNNYTVLLEGVTAGKEEATVTVEEDGTVTVTATQYASASGQIVTLVVKKGDATIFEIGIGVQNTGG